MDQYIDIKVRVWRQAGPKAQGHFETYELKHVFQGASFLEMIDILNEQLVAEHKDPVTYDHDCREGICGMCSMYVNGHPHGPDSAITTCQLHMRKFKDCETITVEPWRSRAFPVIKDLMVDRGAYDKIMQAGGFVSVNTGGVPDANAIPIPKPVADEAMDAASCIGCGACAAACKNGSAMLFVSVSVTVPTPVLAPLSARNRFRLRTSLVSTESSSARNSKTNEKSSLRLAWYGGCTSRAGRLTEPA